MKATEKGKGTAPRYNPLKEVLNNLQYIIYVCYSKCYNLIADIYGEGV